MKGFVSTSNREIKAKKIEAVLKDYLKIDVLKNMKILDIGCGSGLITKYFTKKNKVYCVDVEDQLVLENRNDVMFEKVNSPIIPFANDFFDIVISNHVIEHIEDQGLHLREIDRILKKDGICYFSTPNRNFPMEPHYKIPFINYFSNEIFHHILRSLRKYREDLFLLYYKDMISLFKDNKFDYIEYTSKILKQPSIFYLETQFTKVFPKSLLSLIKYISPTNIFILKK